MFGFDFLFQDNTTMNIPMPIKVGDAWLGVTAQVQFQVRENRIGWFGQVVLHGVKWKPTCVEEHKSMWEGNHLETLPAEEDEDWQKTKTVKWFSRKSLDAVMTGLAVQVGMLREAGELKSIGKYTSTVVYTGKEFDDVS